jgi:superfamily II DNA/RNA helicase
MRRKLNGLPTSSRGNVFRNSKYGNKSNRPKRQGQYIDPQRFINAAVTPKAEEVFESQHSFQDFGFEPKLAAAIATKGYINPTPIQDGAIKPIMNGRDLIGLANTGTGKTATFLLPIINTMMQHPGQHKALILAPTRELAIQINDELRGFVKELRLYSALCVGGANMNRQIEQLRKQPQFVIGTPGRLKDLLNQKALRLERFNMLVLDEADRMLDMGFIRDIRYLIDHLPTQRQSLCFSATITPDIEQLINQILVDPETVSVRKGETSDHVHQDIIRAGSKEEKVDILSDLLRKDEFEKVLVFGETKWGVQKLADSLNKLGISAEAIHGNKSQPQRQRALKAFKDGKVRVLVATDVASRGLDIPQVTHVINFDQPQTYSDYVHRIGRTGRAGNQGHALTFVPA